jgi:hypothetical protein
MTRRTGRVLRGWRGRLVCSVRRHVQVASTLIAPICQAVRTMVLFRNFAPSSESVFTGKRLG